MEEIKNTPKNSSEKPTKTEIDTLLKEMMKKDIGKTPLPDPADSKTPLENLKGILSQADAGAGAKAPGKDMTDTLPPVKQLVFKETNAKTTPKSPIQEKKSLPSLESDAVVRLDELIAAHRAKKAAAIHKTK